MIENFLIENIFAILLSFTRIGSGIMIMPAFGETSVSPRIRIVLALFISLIMAPIIAPKIPPIPDSILSLTVLLASEVIIGLSIGLIARLLLATMHVAGMIISYQVGLAMATQFDSTQATQGSIIGNFLSISAVVMVITTDMHYPMLRGLYDSYTLFPIGKFIPVEDMANYISHLVSDIFLMGIKLASPAIAVGLIIYLGSGVLARLMPNMQVFFIIMPPQIFIGFFVLMSVFTSIMLEFNGFFAKHLYEFLEVM